MSYTHIMDQYNGIYVIINICYQPLRLTINIDSFYLAVGLSLFGVNMRICEINNCEKIHKSRGYCSTHLSRLYRTGDPLKSRNPRTSHGLYKSKEYKIWEGMIQRCHNKNSSTYKYYGGRGITVCDRWKLFINFYADMGEKQKGLTIERIDNDLGYSPNNCKWATMSEQNKNKRAWGTA